MIISEGIIKQILQSEIRRHQKEGLMGKNKFYDRWGVKNETPQETKVSGMETYGVSGEVDLIYIQRLHPNLNFCSQALLN